MSAIERKAEQTHHCGNPLAEQITAEVEPCEHGSTAEDCAGCLNDYDMKVDADLARYKALAGELAEAASAVAELHVLPGESPDVMFERISLLFTRDTGYVSLGKDCRVHDHQTRGDAWNNWVASRLAKLRAALATYDSAIKEQKV